MSTGKLENVEFVSASAGSGKTYTLTERMAEMVGKDGYKPENFILTTYTRAAADEFKEKIRAKFYEKNVSVEGLDNAIIGTIHSVAEQFLMQYWYLLGISPEISILTDSDKAFYMNQTLLQCVGSDDMVFFNSMVNKFKITTKEGDSWVEVQDYNFWKKDLESLISSMVNYNVSNWDDHCRSSKELLAELYGMPEEKNRRIYFALPDKGRVKESLKVVYDAFQLLKPKGKLTQDSIDKKKSVVGQQLKAIEKWDGKSAFALRGILNVMLDKSSLNIATIKEDPNVEEQFVYYETLLPELYKAQEVYESIESYIDKIFCIAKAWGEKYEQYKKENQVMDFSDLEKYFKQLLEMPQVEKEIKGRYRVVMVDEFQDCSPVQVAIFEKLSTLVESNIWVGDVKQAVYGFRGTDIELVERVLNKIDSTITLEKSWRSAKPLVDFANDIFAYSFHRHNRLPKESVRLEVADKNSKLEGDLEHWNIVTEAADDRYKALVDQISLMKESKNMRWADIAVLARTNGEVAKIVKAVKEKGFPVNVLSDGSAERALLDTVIQAVFSISVDNENELSKSVLVQYIGGVDARTLMQNWQSVDMKVIANRIEEKARAMALQSVSDFVESIFVELGVGDLLLQGGLGNESEIYSALQWYKDKAKTYEDRCANLCIASSLPGFLEDLRSGGGCTPANDEGITVATYHKSKGLEWKTVVLWDLHKNYLKYDARNVSGVKAMRRENGYFVCLVPSFICNMMPGKGEEILKDKDGYRQLHVIRLKEEVRLLYVGVTRAKQHLITTTVKSKNSERGMEWFASALDNVNFAQYDEAGKCLKLTVVEENSNKEIIVPAIECGLQDCMAVEKAGKVNVLSPKEGEPEYHPLFLQSSKLPYGGNVELGEVVKFGNRVKIAGKKDESYFVKVGNCLHHFMQLYAGDSEKDIERLKSLAVSYGVEIDCAEAVANAGKFFAKLDDMFAPCKGQLREAPFTMEKDGQVVTGEIDLVYSTGSGDVVVDYKSFPGAESDFMDKGNNFWTGKYAGQLDSCSNALKLSGREVRGMWICYLSLGMMVEVKI